MRWSIKMSLSCPLASHAEASWGCLGGYSFLYEGECLVLLLLDEPCLHELVERDEVQVRERCVVEHAEVAVLRH